MFNASSTSSVLRCVAIAQPTIRRLHTSITTARYLKPAHVGMYVMSATQSWSEPVAREVPIHQVRRRSFVLIAHRRLRPFPPCHALDPHVAHHTSHPVQARTHLLRKIGVDPWCTVRPVAFLVALLDFLQQLCVRLRSGRRGSLEPRIVSAGRDSQHSTLRGNRDRGRRLPLWRRGVRNHHARDVQG